jgi:hypothetical protein
VGFDFAFFLIRSALPVRANGRQATRVDAERRAAEQFPNTMGQCEDLLDASAAEDDNPPAILPTLFFAAPPQAAFDMK